jgi:hypothetical protein
MTDIARVNHPLMGQHMPPQHVLHFEPFATFRPYTGVLPDTRAVADLPVPEHRFVPFAAVLTAGPLACVPLEALVYALPMTGHGIHV